MTQMVSKFSHLNAAVDDETVGNGDMIITAGFAFPSQNCGHLECESAFETRVIPENSNKTVRIDIQRSTHGCSEGQNNLRSMNYGQTADQDSNVIGVVTIGKASDANKKHQNGYGGYQPHISSGCPKDPPRPQTFQVYVKYHENGKTYEYNVEKTTTVDKFMSMIQERLEIPTEQQNLTCITHKMQRGKTLGYYGVERDTTIFLTLRNRGG